MRNAATEQAEARRGQLAGQGFSPANAADAGEPVRGQPAARLAMEDFSQERRNFLKLETLRHATESLAEHAD